MDVPRGRVFQAEGIASAKALGQECAQHPAKKARSPEWLESRCTGKSGR